MSVIDTDNFDIWFEAQHGPRPHPHGKDAELVARINAGIEARAMMRACDMYDARRNSALYAWTASQWARVVGRKRNLSNPCVLPPAAPAGREQRVVGGP